MIRRQADTTRLSGKLTALAGALATILLATSGLSGAAIARPTGAQAAVGGLCQSAVGLEPGQAQYDGCVLSLSQSAQNFSRGQALATAREACLAHGLRADSPALAECELRSSSPGAIRAAVYAAPGPSRLGSYFSASPADRFRREQMACAGLGLDPADQAFARCVAGLAGALFAADNPSN